MGPPLKLNNDCKTATSTRTFLTAKSLCSSDGGVVINNFVYATMRKIMRVYLSVYMRECAYNSLCIDG